MYTAPDCEPPRTIRFVAKMPPHVCTNELVIAPVLNRIDFGEAEFTPACSP